MAPVSLEQAVAAVDGWLASEPMPMWELHQVAIALRQGLDEATKAHVDACNASLATEATLLGEHARLRAKLEQAEIEVNRLKMAAAAAGLALDKPLMAADRREGYTLSHCLDLMGAWKEDVECWGLHQMCRVLRDRVDELQTELAVLYVAAAGCLAVLTVAMLGVVL